VAECLEEVALEGQRNQWCGELSRGQTQRVVLAKTMLHRPRVLILDEPASGLDPLARRDLRMALRKIANDGATVIVSSHILGELSEMCSSLCVMNRGQLLALGSVDEVRHQLGNVDRTITTDILNDRQLAAAWLSSQNGVRELRVDATRIAFHFDGDDHAQASLVEGLIAQGLRIKSFEEKRSSLEDLLVGVAETNRQS
jgi:ABC-2 type transport system ATP-binding protein